MRDLKARFKTVYAISLLATTISPEVPTSSRCTMPCALRHAGGGDPEAGAGQVAEHVGPVQPRLGWAATPTGLSTTTMSSSS